MPKMLLTAALGLAIGAAAAAPSLAAEIWPPRPDRPDPLERYLGHQANQGNTAQPGAGFVGETADNQPVVGHTAGPLPENPLPPEALASAALAPPETAAVAAAPKPPAQ